MHSLSVISHISRRWLSLFLAAVVCGGVAAAVLNVPEASAQSGTRRNSGFQQRQGRVQPSQGRVRQPVQQPFEERLWAWLDTVQYRNWGPMPGQSAGAMPGQSPHGAVVRVYANREAVDGLKNRAILIKENFGEDGETLMAVTVMYRVKGYDPANGDWYWAKYDADGRPSRMNNMPVAGHVRNCMECHAGADGADLVFANDEQ